MSETLMKKCIKKLFPSYEEFDYKSAYEELVQDIESQPLKLTDNYSTMPKGYFFRLGPEDRVTLDKDRLTINGSDLQVEHIDYKGHVWRSAGRNETPQPITLSMTRPNRSMKDDQ